MFSLNMHCTVVISDATKICFHYNVTLKCFAIKLPNFFHAYSVILTNIWQRYHLPGIVTVEVDLKLFPTKTDKVQQ